MPLYEHYCDNEECKRYQQVEEHFFHSSNCEAPQCPDCSRRQVRAMSRFSSPFTGLMTARYNDPKKEGAHMEGHWAYRRKTVSGNPEPVFLETFQQRREFMKSEGLVGYEDAGPNMPDSNGKRVNTTGMPGSWGGTLTPPSKLMEPKAPA